MSDCGFCVFCVKPLKDPVTLVCGHNLCASCLEEASLFSEAISSFADTKNKDSDDTNGDEKKNGFFFVCPICRSKTPKDEIKPNLVLRAVVSCNAQIAEAAANPDNKLVCGFCKEPATKICVFCGTLCDKHSDFLHVEGPMRNHEVRSIESDMKPIIDEKDVSKQQQQMPLCPVHKKRCELLCQNCNMLVCSHCVFIGEHKTHRCQGLNEVFRQLNPMIMKLSTEIREAIPSCKKLLDGFECLEKSADKDHKEMTEEVNQTFKEFSEFLEKKRKETLKDIDDAFDDFQQNVEDRKKALVTLSARCEDYINRVAAEDSLPQSSVARYALFQMLSEINGALHVVANTQPPDEDSKICRVSFKNEMKDTTGFVPASVFRLFRLGSGSKQTVAINLDNLSDSHSFTSPINALERTSHDGSAFYDPQRRIIFAVSGNVNNCKDVLITHITDPTHGTTEIRRNVVPFPSHGQYPVFDGRMYAYFCESEGDGNNRFGRLHLDTFVFEELARFPESFKEFNSGCFSLGKFYAMSEDDRMKQYDPDTNTWSDTGIQIAEECRLLADPCDEGHFYALCSSTRGLYEINVAEQRKTLISNPPVAFDLGQNGEALIVALPDMKRIMFTSLNDRWHYFLFEERRWVELEHWSRTRNGSAHLVIIPDGPVALYHLDEEASWTGVNLG